MTSPVVSLFFAILALLPHRISPWFQYGSSKSISLTVNLPFLFFFFIFVSRICTYLKQLEIFSHKFPHWLTVVLVKRITLKKTTSDLFTFSRKCHGTQKIQTYLELGTSHGPSHHIHWVLIRVNLLHRHYSSRDNISDEMKLDVYVLCSLMEHLIICQMN